MLILSLLLLQPSPVAPFVPSVKPATVWGKAYDEQNPFARILRGEIPVAKVWEDRDILVFMDNQPRTTGHLLVSAKRSRARNVLEMKPALWAKMAKVARRMAQAERDAFGAEGVVIQQNNGIMQSVPHLHIHVYPAWAGVPILPSETNATPLAELQATAAKLRAVLKK